MIPPWARTTATPASPAGVPWAFDIKPAVAVAIEPVPAPDGEPLVVVAGAHDLDLDRGLGDGRAVVVVGFDGGGEFFTELHGILGGIDGDLEFGFFIFLDTEMV